MLEDLSLRPKLMLIIMLTSTVSLFLAFLAIVFFDRHTLRQSLARDMSTLSGILANNTTAPLSFGDSNAATEVLKALQAEPRVAAACIYSPNGRLFARYVRGGGGAKYCGRKPRSDGNYFVEDSLLQYRVIKIEGESIGTLFIESDLTELNQLLRNYSATLALVMFATSLLAYLLAARLQKVITRPALELVRTAERVTEENNYGLRAATHSNDELGSLVQAFNGMLSQIQRRDQDLERQQAELQGEVEARTAMNLQLENAKEIAEGASRAKGDFLANMSHEIRTPINGILGMIELSLDTELSGEQREYLALAKSSGESLLAIINDILDFSKVESGKMELEHIEFNLYNSVGETMKALAIKAHEKNLELAYDVSPDVPSELLGDPGRLRQVLVNLVGNAIKFTAKGEVFLEIVRKSRESSQVELEFKVRDTGIGIPREKQAALFEAFSQADSSTTRKYGGTGLGLAISLRLVDLMSGQIWIDSKEGRGSTFHFTANFTVAAAKPEQAAPILPAELNGSRVLIVDDNATNRRILHDMTARWNMRPVDAESATRAMEMIQSAHAEKDPFRIILLDGCMPETDGFQFAQMLKDLPEANTASVLMLTSGGQAGEAARCEALGISAYLLKPVLQADLQRAMTTVVGLGSMPQPPLVTRHSLRESKRSLRILVAEDNPVNQTLIVRLLQKLGHTSVVAQNGKEAVALAASQKFDFILMDVQMPEMDGLTATALIRNAEKGGSTHIPVYAITARAMKGDNEICLRAGMDGYIPKPVRFSDVERALATVGSSAVISEPPPSQLPAWTDTEALERLGGDEELLRELCQIFLQESPKLLAKLKEASASGDIDTLKRAAHSLKGEVSYLSAEDVSKTAKELERMADENDISQAAPLVQILEAQLARLHADMHEKEKRGVYQ
ncbi:MAG TPA: response regulator [Terriglobales bacterium]|jgi:signal transduction histidine kinase/CheY-like chemotaxis protein|nr:response regulator [Terriglobales bacterium]